MAKYDSITQDSLFTRRKELVLKIKKDMKKLFGGMD